MKTRVPIVDYGDILAQKESSVCKVSNLIVSLRELVSTISMLAEYHFDKRWDVAKLLFQSSIITTEALQVLLLNNNQYYFESLVLSRGLYEKMSNLSYLLYCNEIEFQNYVDYAFYRNIKDKLSKNQIGGCEIGYFFNFESEEQKKHYECVATKFKTRSWTNKKIKERVRIFTDELKISPIFFMSLHELVWNISSEYSHGSLYGLSADINRTLRLNVDRTNERMDDTLVLLIDIIIIYHNVVIDIIGSKYDIQGIIKKLKELNIMKKIINMNSGSGNLSQTMYVKTESGLHKTF